MNTFQIYRYGNPEAGTVLLQMVGEHDMGSLEREAELIRELSGEDFLLAAVKTGDWNGDLSPWPAPAVFGKEDFGGGAEATLGSLLEEVIPSLTDPSAGPKKQLIIGGYSLSALFALWAGTQTDLFAGIAAASPSMWYPGFTDFLREHPPRVDAVYLSLGNKEEKTRNPVMARVGEAIREAEDILKAAGKDCTLEWNQGNHFKEPELRTAKGFAWVMGRCLKE